MPDASCNPNVHQWLTGAHFEGGESATAPPLHARMPRAPLCMITLTAQSKPLPFESWPVWQAPLDPVSLGWTHLRLFSCVCWFHSMSLPLDVVTSKRLGAVRCILGCFQVGPVIHRPHRVLPGRANDWALLFWSI